MKPAFSSARIPAVLRPLLALLAALALCPAYAVSSLAQATGGNKVLMEQWARQKQQTRQQVFEDLKRQGLVPRNGTIVFVATVKKDPGNPGQAKVHVDSVTVHEGQTGKANPATDPIFGPRDPGGPAHVNGVIDVGQVKETIRVVNGVPQ